MNKELDDKLCRDFPNLYSDRHVSMQETCMCWGFNCGDGWFDIIYNLSSKLEPLITPFINKICAKCEHTKEAHDFGMCNIVYGQDTLPEGSLMCDCAPFHSGHPRASQVKEKYGGLRFYMSSSTEEMEKLIDKAEECASKTCEQCGKTGSLRTTSHGWYYTSCDKCDNHDPDKDKIV